MTLVDGLLHMEIAAEGANVAQAPSHGAKLRAVAGRIAQAVARALWRMISSIPQRLDLAARPWRLRALLKAGQSPLRRKLRRATSFAILLVLTSAAMMAALTLPDGEQPGKQPLTAEQKGLRPATAGEVLLSDAIRPMTFATLDQQAWQPVRRPVQAFHLESPETAGSELDYRVNMRGAGARQDLLIWTPRAERAANAARITLVVERYEDAQPTQRPLFADLAARASQQHAAIERMTPPAEIRTKFGLMQVAEAQYSIDGQTFGCLAFRRLDTAGLVLAGWYCAPPQRPVDRVTLACFINRLMLVSAGADHELRRHFAESERQRQQCVSARQPGRKITWIDHEAPVPPLKLSRQGR